MAARLKKAEHLSSLGKKNISQKSLTEAQKSSNNKKMNFNFSDDSESEDENKHTSEKRVQRALRELNIESDSGKRSAFTDKSIIASDDLRRRSELPSLCEELGHPIIESTRLCSADSFSDSLLFHTACDEDLQSEERDKFNYQGTVKGMTCRLISQARAEKSPPKTPEYYRAIHRRMMETSYDHSLKLPVAQKRTTDAGKENAMIPNHSLITNSEKTPQPSHRSFNECSPHSYKNKLASCQKHDLDWDDLPKSPLNESKPVKKLGCYKGSSNFSPVCSAELKKERMININPLMHGQLSVLKKKTVDQDNIHTEAIAEKLDRSTNCDSSSTESSSESYIEVQDVSVQTSDGHEFSQAQERDEVSNSHTSFGKESSKIHPNNSKDESFSFFEVQNCSVQTCPLDLQRSNRNEKDRLNGGELEDHSPGTFPKKPLGLDERSRSTRSSRSEMDSSGDQDLYKTALCGTYIDESVGVEEEFVKQLSCSSIELSHSQESDEINSNSQLGQLCEKETFASGENPSVLGGESILSSQSSTYEVQDVSIQTSLILTPLLAIDSQAEEAGHSDNVENQCYNDSQAEEAGLSDNVENQCNNESQAEEAGFSDNVENQCYKEIPNDVCISDGPLSLTNVDNEVQEKFSVERRDVNSKDKYDTDSRPTDSGDDYNDSKNSILVSASDSENESDGKRHTEIQNILHDKIDESEDSHEDGQSDIDTTDSGKITIGKNHSGQKSKSQSSKMSDYQPARRNPIQSRDTDESIQDESDLSDTENQNTIIKKEITTLERDSVLSDGKRSVTSKQSDNENEMEPDIDDLTERLGAVSLPSYKPRHDSESSDDDDGFEKFLSKVKTTMKPVQKNEDERPPLDEFIVDSEEDESSELEEENRKSDTDDEMFYIKTTNKIDNSPGKRLRYKEVTYTQYHSDNSASSSHEDSDSDLDGFIVDRPVKRNHTKSLIPVFDLSSDDENLLELEDKIKSKIPAKKPTNYRDKDIMDDHSSPDSSNSFKTPKRIKNPKMLCSEQTVMKESHILEPDDDDFKTPFKTPFKTQKILKPWERPFETPTNKHSVLSVFKTPTSKREFSLQPKTAPRPSRPSNIGLDDNSYFLKSLSTDYADYKRHPDAARYVSKFKDRRADLTQKLFRIFNHTVFEEKLPADFEIEWNSRYTKTAGTFYYKGTREKFIAKVTLSVKVCDSPERVRDTLAHELCHAAVKLINGINESHGRVWKSWARRTNRAFPFMPVIARCHDYIINTKYSYQCVTCKYRIQRHSKSLDTDKNVCGHCRGKFEVYLTKELNFSNDEGKIPATPRTPRTPNKFALFVKECYSEVKKREAGLKHADVMKLLSKEFAEKNRICESK